MKDNSSDTLDISLSEIFNKNEKYTFLVGAGISNPSPTSLPLTSEIMKEFLGYLVPSEEKDYILQLNSLRFEQIIELVQKYLDKNLSFIDDFDKREPNLLHHFLATAIKNGYYVVTTNFDSMIEKALLKIVRIPDNVLPVITRKDFIAHSDPELEFSSGKFPLYKIHGSKTNYLTKESTKDSLVTTLTDLGKEGVDQTFSIAPFKKLAFSNLIQDRTLVVMGYSGGDDFDISPTLLELQNLSTIIWINHSKDDITPLNAVINRLKQNELTDDTNHSSIHSSEKLLVQIFRKAIRWERQIEIYIINVDTSLLIRQFLFDHLFPSNHCVEKTMNKLNGNISGSKSNPFTIKATPISDIDKYNIACWIYYDLNEIKLGQRNAQMGLSLSKKERAGLGKLDRCISGKAAL